MLKRGLLFLLVFIIFLQSSLAQAVPDSCLLPSDENVPIVARNILQTYSQLYEGDEVLSVALDSLNRWQPENVDPKWKDFKEEIRKEMRRLNGNGVECIKNDDGYKCGKLDVILDDEMAILPTMGIIELIAYRINELNNIMPNEKVIRLEVSGGVEIFECNAFYGEHNNIVMAMECFTFSEEEILSLIDHEIGHSIFDKLSKNNLFLERWEIFYEIYLSFNNEFDWDSIDRERSEGIYRPLNNLLSADSTVRILQDCQYKVLCSLDFDNYMIVRNHREQLERVIKGLEGDYELLDDAYSFYNMKEIVRSVDRKEEMVDLLKDVISEIDSLGNVVEDDLTDNTQISTPQSLSETNTLESFSEMKARAKRELKCDGITSEQREAYISGISELLYRGILPLNYYPYDKLKEFIPNIIWHRRELANNGREDAWRFYLGLPQTSNTFTISDYKPSLSREDKYYYSIEDFEKKTVFSIEGFLPFFNDGKEYVISQDFLIDANGGIGGSFIMGQYKVSKGQDEKGYYLSYYDIWDLVGFEDKDFNLAGIEGEEGVFGKPFEIYGRIYYDPETFEVLPDETAEEEISCE